MAKLPEEKTGQGKADAQETFEQLGKGSRVVSTIKRFLSPPEGSAKGKKELIDACGKGKLDAVTSLLQSGVKPDQKTAHWTPLIAASEMGHIDIVQALLEARAQVNLTSRETRTALHAASYRGHLDIVRILLERGAEVNMVDQEGQTALHRASFAGHPDIVHLLVERGADVNKQGKDGSTPLHQSSGQGHVAIVQLLLDFKAKTSLRIKKWERSALHSASMGGQTEVVKMLLQTDLCINDQDQNDMTPLIFAAIGGHADTVRFLVHAGANLDAQNKNGMTALMFAVKKDKLEVAKVLVGSGANINIQEHKDDWSAIFFAVEKGNLSMVMLLFEAGADLELGDKHKKTPLNVAKEHSSEVYKKLLEAKAVGIESHQKAKTTKVDSPSAEQKERKRVSCFKYSDKHPGMCFFLNPWRQTVTAEGANICWEEIGIEFDIPHGAMPEGKSLELSVWPSITGPFVLPEGYDLASPVYLISPAFDFVHNITLRMYHYCGLETEQQCDNMVFISSPATPNIVQPHPQYQFKVLSKGIFRHSEAYGCVSLKHFCNTAIAGKRKRSCSESPEESPEEGGRSTKKAKGSNCYSLRMYDAMGEYLAVFSACLNQPMYFKAMKELLKEYFPNTKFKPIIIHDRAQMSSSTVELRWPRDQGWEVLSDRTPEISKDTLDSPDLVTLGEYPPYIELKIKPASVAAGHQCTSHLVFDVLGLSKEYQFTLDLETKNIGSVGAHFSTQPHMHSYTQATYQQSPQYHMLPGRASLSPPYSPPYLDPMRYFSGQSYIHSQPYGPTAPYLPSYPPVQYPSGSGPPLPSPPYSADPVVPLSNLSVEDNGSRKVLLFRADARPDIRLLHRFPCSSRPSGYINILTQAASHYQMVGNILLNSSDGATVRMIELHHNKDPQRIIYDIFQIWLTQDPKASWRILVQCLRDAAEELNTVAKDIEDNLIH